MIMPLLRALLRPSRVRKSIFGNIALLRTFTNDFPFSLKKCIRRSDCTLPWDIYLQMNLKPWPYKLITLYTPVHHSNFDCPIPGVQPIRPYGLFVRLLQLGAKARGLHPMDELGDAEKGDVKRKVS
jgi:hypothetical protein